MRKSKEVFEGNQGSLFERSRKFLKEIKEVGGRNSEVVEGKSRKFLRKIRKFLRKIKKVLEKIKVEIFGGGGNRGESGKKVRSR